MDLKGKRVLVVGFGLSGQAAAELLLRKGANVLVIDESEDENMKRRAKRKKLHGVQIQFGVKTAPENRFDVVIVSPGIDPRHSLGKDIFNLDVPILGELELGSWFCQCPLIAITGTNGKTTTTELTEKVIRANRKKTLAVGNIGIPLSEAALKSDKLDYLVVEVSSFQLETIETFRPSVSVMMNITPDHLDRYHSFEEYAKAKADLWKNQRADDVAIVNIESERLLAGLGYTPNCKVLRYSTKGEAADFKFDGESIICPVIAGKRFEFRLSDTRLRGAHNAENMMAALAIAYALDLNPEKAWKAICEYSASAHRLEIVGNVNGIEFINDSKATNVDAMEKAIDSYDQPIILIAGGKDKGFDFSSATPLIREKVKTCILIGEVREKLFHAWKDAASCVFADSLQEAVQMGANLAKQGDVVLLSPACSSFDMFENYKERGEVFRRAVQQLKPNPTNA
jgi:UDP-N-acetylmuramoylalanine--D-glutamate ligase